MEKKEFKVGHVAEHEGKVGITTTNEINGIISFKILDEDSYEIASDKVHGIPLSDELFAIMGFKIKLLPRGESQNPKLNLFTLMKLNNEHPFLWVHKGEILYSESEKAEIYTVCYHHRGPGIKIDTIDELQDFFDFKKCKLEFDNDMLWKIEQELLNRIKL